MRFMDTNLEYVFPYVHPMRPIYRFYRSKKKPILQYKKLRWYGDD